MHDQCDVVIILDLKDELYQADEMNTRIQSISADCFYACIIQLTKELNFLPKLFFQIFR